MLRFIKDSIEQKGGSVETSDIGSYYTTDGEDIWQLITYCSEPTATMLNIRTGEKTGGAVGCLNLQPFVKLVPEKELKDGKQLS